MVFFTCDGCNESLKKNQVDKHCYRCRDCASVTCIDCGVTYYGDDYKSHNTCITESEKYEKTLFKSKMKLSPQDVWMTTVSSAIETSDKAPSNIQLYLQKLSEFSNIPRNKQKFINFVQNSLKLRSIALVEEIWDWLSSLKVSNETKESTTLTNEESNNISIDETPVDQIKVAEEGTEVKIKKTKKRKVDDTVDTNETIYSDTLNEDSIREISKKKKKMKRDESCHKDAA